MYPSMWFARLHEELERTAMQLRTAPWHEELERIAMELRAIQPDYASPIARTASPQQADTLIAADADE